MAETGITIALNAVDQTQNAFAPAKAGFVAFSQSLSQLFPTLLHQQQKQEVVRRQPISLVGPMQRNKERDQHNHE